MISGLFLDPRAWEIDFKSSSFWQPEKFGCNIDLHPDAFRIPEIGIDPKYKFVLCTEVWEIPLRKTLDYLRSKGLKIFLVAREPFKTAILKDAMFSHEKFLYNNEYYFKPDAVFAAGRAYAELWQDKTDTIVTGYPRFDYYVDKNKWRSKKDICKQYDLNSDKKIIFFPSYPPYHYKKIDGKDTLIDLFQEQEDTLFALEQFAIKHTEYQVVAKIHPVAWKAYVKNKKSKDVSGLMQKYLLCPQPYMKIIGDNRYSGIIAKELLLAADTVVAFTSTMLLEASILDKKCIHILFGKTFNLIQYGIPEYFKFVPTALDQHALEQLLISNESLQIPRNVVENFLFKIDGNVCERICSAIKERLIK